MPLRRPLGSIESKKWIVRLRNLNMKYVKYVGQIYLEVHVSIVVFSVFQLVTYMILLVHNRS